MRNIEKITPFQSTIQKASLGIITTLVTEFGVSAKETISMGDKTLLASYVYKNNDTYDLVYTIVGTDGDTESFAENDGVLPTLFLSPGRENYVSIIPYNPDRELEISIPVFNRENIEFPKGNRPFVGNFIGTTHQFSIFYDVDVWSKTKPDKMLAIEFKNDVIKKKHNIKVPLPRNNKVFIQNNEIHLLSNEGDVWVHRQIDELGKVKQEREINSNPGFFWQILSLSFNNNSYILFEEDGKISIATISKENNCESKFLFDIEDPFYNTWQPVKISEDTFVTRFNTEFGNGWLTTKDGQLIEIYYSKNEPGYRNLLNGCLLELNNNDLVISGISKTKDNGYAVVFYPMTEQNCKNKTLVILNRELS